MSRYVTSLPVLPHRMSGPGLGRGKRLRIGPRETMVAANKAAKIRLSLKEAVALALLLITAARN